MKLNKPESKSYRRLSLSSPKKTNVSFNLKLHFVQRSRKQERGGEETSALRVFPLTREAGKVFWFRPGAEKF